MATADDEDDDDKEVKEVKKVWNRMMNDPYFAMCIMRYHLIPGESVSFQNDKSRETGKYDFATAVSFQHNGGPAKITVDYKKGSKPTIKTYLDKIQVTQEDKFTENNHKTTCRIHIINGVIIPFDPDKIDSQTCVPKDKKKPAAKAGSGDEPMEMPHALAGGTGEVLEMPITDVMQVARSNCDIVQMYEALAGNTQFVESLISGTNVRYRTYFMVKDDGFVDKAGLSSQVALNALLGTPYFLTHHIATNKYMLSDLKDGTEIKPMNPDVTFKIKNEKSSAQVLSDRVVLGIGETGVKNTGITIDVKSKDGKTDPRGVRILRGDIPVHCQGTSSCYGVIHIVSDPLLPEIKKQIKKIKRGVMAGKSGEELEKDLKASGSGDDDSSGSGNIPINPISKSMAKQGLGSGDSGKSGKKKMKKSGSGSGDDDDMMKAIPGAQGFSGSGMKDSVKAVDPTNSMVAGLAGGGGKLAKKEKEDKDIKKH